MALNRSQKLLESLRLWFSSRIIAAYERSQGLLFATSLIGQSEAGSALTRSRK